MDTSPDAVDPLALARVHRLTLATRPRRGLSGLHFGRGTGSSLEFQELREYQLGDDLRHVDWRSYARTGHLHSRLYRDEVAPVAELVVDTSRSMALTPAKARAVRWATRFCAALLSADAHLRGLRADDPPRLLTAEALLAPDLPGLDLDGRRALPELPLAALLRPGALRVVVSDFLFPHDPSRLVGTLGRNAGALLLLAVLDPDEIDPPRRGSLRLRDVESDVTVELPVDDRAAARYGDRLDKLWSGLRDAARRRAAVTLRWNAAVPPDEWVTGELLAQGVVEPR